MKDCIHCGASNNNAAKFCNKCGKSLSTVTSAPTIESKLSKSATAGLDLEKLEQTVNLWQGKRKADIMFVLDCTGSMQGEIDAIRDAITAFADTIESDGVRVRVGLVEFRDRLIDEEQRVLLFSGQAFTNDPVAFKKEVATLTASGGGDEPESSLDAVMLALRQPFTEDGNKVIVLVTDAPPHLPDKETKSIEEVIQKIKEVGVQQFYLVIPTQDARNQIYLKLLEGTRGMAIELGKGDDFRNRTESFKPNQS